MQPQVCQRSSAALYICFILLFRSRCNLLELALSDRPLHEIKKKGRPTTQCLHCKDLRKAKQVLVRCKCGQDEGTFYPRLSAVSRTLGGPDKQRYSHTSSY
jgi:hypothetical protein